MSRLPMMHLAPQTRAETAMFGRVILFAIENSETNLSTVATRWRVPEETLRNWRDKGGGPTFDRLHNDIWPRMNAAERLFLLELVARSFATVTENDRSELPATVTLEAVRVAKLQMEDADHAHRRAVEESLSDNRITPDEAEKIQLARNARQGASNWFGRLVSHLSSRAPPIR